MSELTTLARPYAKAAFEFALEQDNLSSWTEMLEFLSLVVADPAMAELLDSPSVTREKSAQAMLSIAEGRLDSQASNFVSLLASNARLELLPEILSLYENYRANHEKTIEVELLSAVELTKQQLSDLNSTLETKLGRKVNINCQTDPTLMGGMIVRAGDLVIDASTRGKLNDLADSLGV
ncbi:MAG: F0F1 ATP synthase subunit delta [Gammaproteobacteria bacterium]|nr:MAG: F0F1 ATP synthase subunit delta [Gammaproteobacteria bacterium]